jgi:hypothetical protein
MSLAKKMVGVKYNSYQHLTIGTAVKFFVRNAAYNKYYSDAVATRRKVKKKVSTLNKH